MDSAEGVSCTTYTSQESQPGLASLTLSRKQMAKDRAAKTQAAKGAADQGQQSGNQEKK